MNLSSSPISSLCLIWVSALRIWVLRETFFSYNLSMSASFVLNLSSMYFINFSASYLPVLPFSAAERNLPKSKASFLISAMDRSVPSRIALSLSSSVSDFSLPSSILNFKVSNSLLAISYFCSALSFSLLSLVFYFFLDCFFCISRSSSISLWSCLVLLRMYDWKSWFSLLIYSLSFSTASSLWDNSSSLRLCKSAIFSPSCIFKILK